MSKHEFTINIKVSGKYKGRLNLVSDTNNIDYVLELVREFLVELKDQEKLK